MMPHSDSADLILRVGPPVHGGHCLTRTQEGRIVFVRHGVPGELVRARITATGKIWRADTVEVLEPSPDRVSVAWPEAGPGGVGAVDLAHVRLEAQRQWKQDVIADALQRIGGVDRSVTVWPAPGESDGWGSRTRIAITCDDQGRPGMYGHRSHEIHPISTMPLAVPQLQELGVFEQQWTPGSTLRLVAPSAGAPVLLHHGRPARFPGTQPRGHVTEQVFQGDAEYTYRVPSAGFWQNHRGAPATLAEAVLARAGDIDGATVIDLYSGAAGAVHAVESARDAGAAARHNTRMYSHVQHWAGDVTRMLKTTLPARADIVVLDPPRRGAGAETIAEVIRRRPRAIIYVACDPAALARDIFLARSGGYTLTSVTGYDLFCHTHHVETVAVLTPDGN